MKAKINESETLKNENYKIFRLSELATLITTSAYLSLRPVQLHPKGRKEKDNDINFDKNL